MSQTIKTTWRVLPLDKTADKIRSVLSDDLLKPYWRQLNAQVGAHRLKGHCYVATEAYYHACGQAKGYTPRVLTTDEGTHWWLQDESGAILDLTAEQFEKPVAYELGRKIGFLTKAPSKRARTVLERAGLELAAEKTSPVKKKARGLS